MNVSTLEMFTYVRGVEYPTSKETIIENAKGNGASSKLINTIEMIPKGTYFSLIDVVEEIRYVGSTDDMPQLAY